MSVMFAAEPPTSTDGEFEVCIFEPCAAIPSRNGAAHIRFSLSRAHALICAVLRLACRRLHFRWLLWLIQSDKSLPARAMTMFMMR